MVTYDLQRTKPVTRATYNSSNVINYVSGGTLVYVYRQKFCQRYLLDPRFYKALFQQ